MNDKINLTKLLYQLFLILFALSIGRIFSPIVGLFDVFDSGIILDTIIEFLIKFSGLVFSGCMVIAIAFLFIKWLERVEQSAGLIKKGLALFFWIQLIFLPLAFYHAVHILFKYSSGEIKTYRIMILDVYLITLVLSIFILLSFSRNHGGNRLYGNL
ncbi:MAG: hypothetical protein ABIG95_05070 [Candidatus Woesearchaeota archaeon]